MEPYTAVTPGPSMYRTLEWQVTTYLCFFKTLSENRQIEQDVGVGELNERLPVSDFLRPASAEAATFGQPRNRALYHPSPRRVNLLRTRLGGRTLGSCGGAFRSRIDLDVSDVARGGCELPQVVGIIDLVGTQMLLLASSRRTLAYHRNDQI